MMKKIDDGKRHLIKKKRGEKMEEGSKREGEKKYDKLGG